MKKYVSKLMINEEGSGLILALMTLMVLAVLGASLGAITIGSHRLGAVNRDDTSAYYIAEAGANQAYEEIETIVLSSYEDGDSEAVFFEKLKNKLTELQNSTILDHTDFEGSDSHARIKIKEMEKEDSTRSYQIRSEGFVSGRSRVVDKEFDVSYVKEETEREVPKLMDYAVIAKKRDVSRNAKISKDRDYIGNEEDKYKKLVDAFPDKNDFPNSINLNNGGTIETSKTSPVNIKTNSLDLDNLIITGDGIVNIYVSNRLKLGNSFTGSHKAKNVRIFYAGNDTLKPPENYEFNGSLHIKKAKIEFFRGATFRGPVLSKVVGKQAITFRGEGNNATVFKVYLIAPYAELHPNAGAKINGVIVANEVKVAGQTEINNDGSRFQDDFDFNLSGENTNGDIITSRPVIEPK